MDQQKREGLTTAPEKLMQNFTASRFLLWIGAAVGLHAVFIGLFSLGYIRDKIDPAGAALRKAATEAAAKAEPQRQKSPLPVSAAPETTASAAKPAPVVTNEEALLEARRNTPVVRAITQMPKPGEIPSQPGELGIDIEDTNVK